MNPLAALIIPSVVAILILPFIRHRLWAARLSACLTICSFFLGFRVAIAVYDYPHHILFFAHHWLLCDTLSAFFIVLNTFISMTTACYAVRYITHEGTTGQLQGAIYRFYHTTYHIFVLSMLVVLISNNLGMLWIAMELATIAAVILIALYQTKEALEAAWKYLILCGVGLGLALLGTVMMYFASHDVLSGYQGLLWSALVSAAPLMPPQLLALAFVFIVVGYGTKVGFFPLHNWLPDAHAEGPSSLPAVLSGLLLNVAFCALLRFALILEHTTVNTFAHTLFLIFGFMSLLFGSCAMLRQRTVKRLFAYSSIEHMGIISIAIGIATPLAYLAAFLHIIMHSLSKSAVFFTLGHIIQRAKTQTLSHLNGLLYTQPLSAWLLLLSTLALLGLPPSGLFISELLILLTLLQINPLLAFLFVLGLGIAFCALFAKTQRLVFSKPKYLKMLDTPRTTQWPIVLHLCLVGLSGALMPIFLLQPVVLFLQGNQ